MEKDKQKKKEKGRWRKKKRKKGKNELLPPYHFFIVPFFVILMCVDMSNQISFFLFKLNLLIIFFYF
jgi:hypothetical protein